MRKFGERESQSESERARESQRERESDLSLSVSLSGSLTGNLSFRLCTAMACTSEHICSTSKGNNTCQNTPTPQDVLSLCLQQVTAAPNFWSQLWNLREQHDERGEAAVMILILFSCPESGLQTPDSSNSIPTHQPSKRLVTFETFGQSDEET